VHHVLLSYLDTEGHLVEVVLHWRVVDGSHGFRENTDQQVHHDHRGADNREKGEKVLDVVILFDIIHIEVSKSHRKLIHKLQDKWLLACKKVQIDLVEVFCHLFPLDRFFLANGRRYRQNDHEQDDDVLFDHDEAADDLCLNWSHALQHPQELQDTNPTNQHQRRVHKRLRQYDHTTPLHSQKVHDNPCQLQVESHSV